MIKLSRKHNEIKASNELLIGADVGKGSIYFYSEFDTAEGTFSFKEWAVNQTKALASKLTAFEAEARKHGFSKLALAVEPSGGYERICLELVRARGHRPIYVSGEATSKARVIESNDTSKNDIKDAQVVFRVASMGKSLSCGKLPEAYGRLRILNGFYEAVDIDIVKLKNQIDAVLEKLFPDYSAGNNFLYSKTGLWLMERFKLNPKRIGEMSFNKLIATAAKKLRKFSLNKLKTIYQNAKSGQCRFLSQGMIEILEDQLTVLFESLKRALERKKKLRERMLDIYGKLEEYKSLEGADGTKEGFLTARMIAETGPLNAFKSANQLLRFTGMNLKTFESGNFKGKRRLSKKGRPLARKILYQIVFGSLIHEGKLFGEAYVIIKRRLANGLKAIVALMRKFIRVIHGIYRSKKAFDPRMVFRSPLIYDATG